MSCLCFAGDLSSFPATDPGGSLPPWQTRMSWHWAHVRRPHRPAQDRLQYVHEGQTLFNTYLCWLPTLDNETSIGWTWPDIKVCWLSFPCLHIFNVYSSGTNTQSKSALCNLLLTRISTNLYWPEFYPYTDRCLYLMCRPSYCDITQIKSQSLLESSL